MCSSHHPASVGHFLPINWSNIVSVQHKTRSAVAQAVPCFTSTLIWNFPRRPMFDELRPLLQSEWRSIRGGGDREGPHRTGPVPITVRANFQCHARHALLPFVTRPTRQTPVYRPPRGPPRLRHYRPDGAGSERAIPGLVAAADRRRTIPG